MVCFTNMSYFNGNIFKKSILMICKTKETNKTLKLLCFESFNVVDQCMYLCYYIYTLFGSQENERK